MGINSSLEPTGGFLLRLLRLTGENRRLLLGSILCGLVFSAVDLIPPLILRRLVQLLHDGALTGTAVLFMALALGGLSIVRGLFRYGYGVLSHIAAYRTLHQLLSRTYNHIQSLKPEVFTRSRSGALMSQAVNDVEVIEDFIAHGIPESLLALVIPIAMMGVLFSINSELAIIVILPLPFLGLGVYLLASRTNRVWREVRGRRADLVAEILDRMAGYQVVKSFVGEEEQARQIRAHSSRYRDSIVRANLWSLLPAGFVEVSSGLAYVMVAGAGGYLALGNRLELADLVLFVLYMSRIFIPLLRVANLNETLQKAAASAARVFQLLDTPGEVEKTSSFKPPAGMNWNVQLDRVRFAYAPEVPVLDDVSFQVGEGEVVALVGPTGAGKTSCCNLIPRFYEVREGAVRIGGHDVRQLPLKFLRSHVAHVMQDVFLFHSTIRDNILFGRPDASEEELHQAARDANAEAFILSLPEGYDTMVGERGTRLSGGEKQRISIARALLKDAPILILDEATSSIDAESEAEIRAALSRLAKGRTLIVIAHRLSTVRNADRLVVLQKGRVFETGNHEELMRLGGLYARMFELQDASHTWQLRSLG